MSKNMNMPLLSTKRSEDMFSGAREEQRPTARRLRIPVCEAFLFGSWQDIKSGKEVNDSSRPI